MNLKESINLSQLSTMQNSTIAQKTTATKVARRVFAKATEEGRPFEHISAKQWAERWLSSDEFVLMNIETSKAAIPGMPRDRNKVLANLRASANSLEPIVVDLNKQNIGRTPSGFVPIVIVVDGKHRHVSRTMQGHGTIEAWVGMKALKHVRPVQAKITIAAAVECNKSTKMEATVQIQIPRQDVAVGGHSPKMPIPSRFPTKGNGNLDVPLTPTSATRKKMKGMGGPGAGLGNGGSSNPARIGVYSQNDMAHGMDPSDLHNGKGATVLPDPSDEDQTSPSKQSVGSGSGPRSKPSSGASNSEMSQKLIESEGIRVKKIVTKNKKKR